MAVPLGIVINIWRGFPSEITSSGARAVPRAQAAFSASPQYPLPAVAATVHAQLNWAPHDRALLRFSQDCEVRAKTEPKPVLSFFVETNTTNTTKAV